LFITLKGVYLSINKNRHMKTFKKYSQNLKRVGNEIKSYNTIVARIEGNDLLQLGYWSQTTQKHINYVADELDLILIKE